jgi:hypothetical protein
MSKHLLTAAGVFLLTTGLAANVSSAAAGDKAAPDGHYIGDGAKKGDEASGEEAADEEATGEEAAASGEQASGEQASGEQAGGEQAGGEETTGDDGATADGSDDAQDAGGETSEKEERGSIGDGQKKDANARSNGEMEEGEKGEKGDGEKEGDDKEVEYPPSANPSVDLLFAANLDKLDTACHRDEPAGCAIHRATLNIDTGAVSSVRVVDRHESMGTWFPVWMPGGDYMLFEQLDWSANKNLLMARHFDSGTRTKLTEYARFPSVNDDGSLVIWSSSNHEGGIKIADFTAGQSGAAVLNNTRNLSDKIGGEHKGTDAQFIPGMRAVAFHQKGDNTQSGILPLDEGGPTYTTADIDGCGHTAVSPDGKAFICGLSSGPGIYVSHREGDKWNKADVAWPEIQPEDVAAASEYYQGDKCERILLSYPEFCGSSDRLLASVQCASVDDTGHATIQFSRLFLVAIDINDNTVPAHLIDLNAKFEEASGIGAGKSMAVTATCHAK